MNESVTELFLSRNDCGLIDRWCQTNAVRLIEIKFCCLLMMFNVMMFMSRVKVSFKTADCGSHRCYPYPRLKIWYWLVLYVECRLVIFYTSVSQSKS